MAIQAKVVHAISIRQPWAELILRGVKTKEFRSRPTRIRERVYLYASLRPAKAPAAWRRVGKRRGELPAGLIVGSVEIVDCRWDNTERGYAYVLRRPGRLRRYRHPENQPMPAFWRPKF